MFSRHASFETQLPKHVLSGPL